MAKGFPDFQRITEWLGEALDSRDNFALTAGPDSFGPFQVRNWRGCILAAKGNGGTVTAVLRSTHATDVSGLAIDQEVTIPSGTVLAQPFAFYGDTATLLLTRSAGGVTVDFALIPSNTIDTVDTLGGEIRFSVNGTLVGERTGLNLIESGIADITGADNAGAERVDITIAVNPFDVSTTFPASPVDEQLHVYPFDASAGIYWLFVYESSTGTWNFLSGPPAFSEVTTTETKASGASYGALATAGPSIALPFAADYDVMTGFGGSGGGSADRYMSFDRGGTGAVDGDATTSTTSGRYSVARRRRITGLSAVTLTAKYKAVGADGVFGDRWMAVWPVKK